MHVQGAGENALGPDACVVPGRLGREYDGVCVVVQLRLDEFRGMDVRQAAAITVSAARPDGDRRSGGCSRKVSLLEGESSNLSVRPPQDRSAVTYPHYG